MEKEIIGPAIVTLLSSHIVKLLPNIQVYTNRLGLLSALVREAFFVVVVFVLQ